MRSHHFLIIGIAIFLFAGFSVWAQDLSGIAFPVSELGNCQSQEECAAYCDKEENMTACLGFAEENNLIPVQELKMARKMLEAGATSGPGGCKGQAECAAYCDDISNLKECVSFAEQYNLMSADELQEAKKVEAAMERGIQPPNCKNKSECDIYCQQPEHMEECITFGEAAGLIPAEELEMAKKILELSKQGVNPPPCRGDKECDEYCAVEEHFEECITFAQAAGMMSAEDAAMARKTGGKGPGGCRGKEVCDAFCNNPANMATCMEFGLEYGFVPPEEMENTRRALEAIKKGVLPPNCQGEEECQVYCSQSEHMEECVNFSEAAGYMTAEGAAQARQGMQMMQQGGPGGCQGEECAAYCNEVTHMEECLLFSYENGLMSPEDLEKSKGIIEAIQKGAHMLPCRNEEECNVYCQQPENMEECINFSVASGFMTPEQGEQAKQPQQMQPMQPPEAPIGPAPMPLEGKCTSAPECEQYCAINPMDPGCLQALQGPPPAAPEVPPPQAPQMTPPEGEIMQPPSSGEIQQIQQQEMERAMQQIQQMVPETPSAPME